MKDAIVIEYPHATGAASCPKPSRTVSISDNNGSGKRCRGTLGGEMEEGQAGLCKKRKNNPSGCAVMSTRPARHANHMYGR